MEKNDITIVVRSVGERTTEKCIEHVKFVFNTDCVEVLRDITPFQAMLKKCYEIGIERARKWTLCIDADVFMDKSKTEHFLNNVRYWMETVNYFSFTPCVFDYLMNKSRPAGIHLYNTRLLNEAINCIEYTSLRPETSVKRQMADKGYPSLNISCTVGIHDFFNSYESLMMKGLLHVKKHANKEQLIVEWTKKAQEDKNFAWLVKAVAIADKIPQEDMKVDASWARQVIHQYYDEFPEQPSITDQEIDFYVRKYSIIDPATEVLSNKTNSSDRKSIITLNRIKKYFYKILKSDERK